MKTESKASSKPPYPFILFVLVAELIAPQVLANNEANLPPLDCVKVQQEGGNNYEMKQCAALENTQADNALNKAYAELKSKLEGDGLNALIEAERAWIKWRDKESALCASTSGFTPDGSGYGLIVISCMTDLTRERTTTLNQYLKEITQR